MAGEHLVDLLQEWQMKKVRGHKLEYSSYQLLQVLIQL